MSREAWLQARQGEPGAWTVGGSDLGAILGCSPYETALGLWLLKTGRVAPREPDDAMLAGQFLEGGILDWYAAQTGREVIHGAALVEMFATGHPLALQILERAEIAYADDEGRLVLRSRRYPWLAGSVDAVALDPELGPGIVDSKATGFGEIEAWTEGAPPHYSAQLAGYRLVTGLAWSGFAVLFGGQRLGWSDEPRDEVLEARCLRASRDFVALLGTDSPPDPDTARGDVGALRALHKDVSARTLYFPTTILVDGDRLSALDFDEQWVSAGEDLRYARQRREIMETTLRHLMGSAREILLPSGARYRRNATKVWRRDD